jgi:hypothetical protein
MKLLLSTLVLVGLLALCQCQTRPDISLFYDSFVMLEVTVKEDNATFRGDGYWRVDQPKGLGVENYFFHNRTDHHHARDMFRLERYDLGVVYEIDNATYCNKTKVTGSMPDEWAWLTQATYKGQKTFRGQDLDVWEFSAGYATLNLYVADNDTNTPVFLSRDAPEVFIVMAFFHFVPDHPAAAWFDVPALCGQTDDDELEYYDDGVNCVARSTMTSRAQVWVDNKVPYNQDATYQGYREDCSGYVSMTWGTSKPGYTTFTMPQIAHPITRDDLQPGDVLLCASEHVVFFGGWVDSANYIGYEETQPGQGTIKSSVPYPYWYNTACFLPYRYNSVC